MSGSTFSFEAAEPLLSDVRSCRSCGAPVIWAVTTSLSKMPVDAEPVEDGNVALMAPRHEGSLRAIVLGPLDTLTHESPLRTSHFATCPQAKSWRR